ncbi:MAG: DEAD/DEAH box helicase [bacterium]
MKNREPNEEQEAGGFDGLGIAPKLLDALKGSGFKNPTPIQAQAIPVCIEGRDIVGIAQTGTGKTMAFSVPMLQRIAREGGQGLVVLPTRELALQVDEELVKIAKRFGLRTSVLIGGASMNRQVDELRRRPHVIIVTPGRLIDHLQRRTASLDGVRVVVLDEADRMFDMGFAPQIRRIMQSVPEERQTMLFSATMPDEIARLAQQYMHDPERIEVARAGTASDLVEQQLFVVPKQDKMRLLRHALKEERGTVLVFSRTKFGAKRITRELCRDGEKADEIHSNRTLAQRRSALSGFKKGKHRVLVATDIAARGIDVTGISLVVNYDLPEQAEDYVHRIGRTGRAERTGRAVSFAEPDQGQIVTEIELLTQKRLDMRPLPFEPSVPLQPMTSPSRRRSRGGGRSSGGAPGRRMRRPSAGPSAQSAGQRGPARRRRY